MYLYLHSCATTNVNTANVSQSCCGCAFPANVFICMRTTGSPEACLYANAYHDYRGLTFSLSPPHRIYLNPSPLYSSFTASRLMFSVFPTICFRMRRFCLSIFSFCSGQCLTLAIGLFLGKRMQCLKSV